MLTLEPNTTIGFKPSDDEKELFYLIENSNVKLREFVWTFKDLYVSFFKERITSQKLEIKLTVIISIVIVMIVGISVLPIISKS